MPESNFPESRKHNPSDHHLADEPHAIHHARHHHHNTHHEDADHHESLLVSGKAPKTLPHGRID